MKLNPKVNVLYQSELRRDKISVIGTGPEPAKPAGLTGLQGWPVRSGKKFQKTGFLSRPGMEPAKTGQNRPNRPVWTGDSGNSKKNLKTRKLNF